MPSLMGTVLLTACPEISITEMPSITISRRGDIDLNVTPLESRRNNMNTVLIIGKLRYATKYKEGSINYS